MIALERARQSALSMPDVVEQDHHGFPSFRVAGKIFATQPDAQHFNVMLDETGVRAAIGIDPDGCKELWWGKRLRGVRVNLGRVDPDVFVDLLGDAWKRKSPPRLARCAFRISVLYVGVTARGSESVGPASASEPG